MEKSRSLESGEAFWAQLSNARVDAGVISQLISSPNGGSVRVGAVTYENNAIPTYPRQNVGSNEGPGVFDGRKMFPDSTHFLLKGAATEWLLTGRIKPPANFTRKAGS